MSALTAQEKKAARHLLYMYNLPGGYRPGSFTTHLIIALQSADPQNKERVLRAFPEYRTPLAMLNTARHEALLKALEQ